VLSNLYLYNFFVLNEIRTLSMFGKKVIPFCYSCFPTSGRFRKQWTMICVVHVWKKSYPFLLFLLSYFGEIQKTVDDDMCLYFLNIDKPCRSGADSWSSVYELRAEESICCVKSDVYVPNNERNQKSTSVSTLLRVRRLRRHGRTVL
jgi:hypothetical protein